MRILILGGTYFAGRVLTERALEAGHAVTLFNRGRTNPELFPDAERLVGDRDGDVSALDGRDFDAVIDTSGYFPRQITNIVETLGEIGHYTFVSSSSVYADHSIPGADESGDVDTVTAIDDEDNGANYGGFKALCELELERLLAGRVHNVRAGLIVGPHDNTRRFSYWVRRIAEGGIVLAPEPRDFDVQIIDVRDLADWMLHGATTRVSATLNACGDPMTMTAMLEEIVRVTGSGATLRWVDEQLLIDAGVGHWQELPLWIPPRKMPTHVGFLARSNEAAKRFGLTLRPLSDTVEALAHFIADGEQIPDKDFGNPNAPAGLTPEREAELLQLADQAELL